jgi:hypothetical protein
VPSHGWTANLEWHFEKSGVNEELRAAWAYSTLTSPHKTIPLRFKKIDAVILGQNAYYSSLTIQNQGSADIAVCTGLHNTVGAPFLQAGCRISASAKNWTTPPRGGEFDATTRLALNTEFTALNMAPLAYGGRVDISLVTGPIGYTDFVTGAIPSTAPLGWSAVVNPVLKMAYISFCTGPAAPENDDLILRFNDLWLQYGGRPFTPWAPYEGGTDTSYCLGVENTIAAYAYGLEFSRRVQQVLGAPTTVTIPAGGEKTLRSGTLFTPYQENRLDGGVAAIELEEKRLVCLAAERSESPQYFSADPSFTVLKALQTQLNR